MKKIVLTFTLILLCAIHQVYAYDFSAECPTGQNLRYTILNAGVSTVSVSKDPSLISGMLVIPEQVTYNGVVYTVTSIAENGFDQTDFTSITLPNSITTISKFVSAPIMERPYRSMMWQDV